MENRIRLQFDDTVDVAEAVCTNISIGGMQVASASPRPRGSLVRFDLEIEEGVGIRGLGEVVWMRTDSPGSGRDPGMGIKFRFIEQRDRQLIYKIVSEHIKERLAHKHPPLEEPAGASPEVAETPVSRPSDQETQSMASPWETDEPLDLPEPSSKEPRRPEPDDSSTAVGPPAAASPAGGGEFGFEPPAYSSARSHDGGFEDAPQEVDVGERRYKSEQLYHPRPARRRELPVILIVLLLLLVGVVIVYVYWDDLVGPASPPAEKPPAVAFQASGDPPEPAPPTGASTAPVDEEPPLSIAAGEPPVAGARAELEPPPPPEPETAPPPEPEPPPPPQARRPFTQVVDISWTRTPGGVKIEIETDGAIPQERFSHFRLAGDSPREVVKLTGVVRQFSRGTIPVGGSPVSQIRVGYHPGPRELHVVLDMLDRSTRIARLRSQGSTLEVYLE